MTIVTWWNPTRRISSYLRNRYFVAALLLTALPIYIFPFDSGFEHRSLRLSSEVKNETQQKVDKLKLLREESPKLESTIVTAYFSMPGSKHSDEMYLQWFENMACIDDAMVIFTSPDLIEHFTELRSHASNRTIVISMDLEDIEVGNDIQFSQDYWRKQNDRNNYLKPNTNGNLFKIWLAKPWFVNKAIEINPFYSDVYSWFDIGQFGRGPKRGPYCGKTFLLHPELVPNDRILFFAARALKPIDIKLESKPIFNGWGSSYIAGGAFSGNARVWPRFLEKMEETIGLYDKNDVGLQDDQPVLQSTCMHNPGLCSVVTYDIFDHTNSGDFKLGYFWARSYLHFGLDLGPNGDNKHNYHTWDPGMGITNKDMDFDFYGISA